MNKQIWLAVAALAALLLVLFVPRLLRVERVNTASSGMSVAARDERAPEAASVELAEPARVELADEDASRAPSAAEPTAARRAPTLEATREWLQRVLPDRYASLSLADARALAELDLTGAALTDADLERLATLPNLRTLVLRGTPISDRGLAALSALPLEFLDLRDTHVSGACFAALPTASLKALHLTDTRVAGAELAHLPAMPALQVLKLNRLQLVDADLEALAIYPQLKHVELDSTPLTDAGLRRMLELNPQLTRIEARDTKVTRAAVDEVRAAHPGLEIVCEDQRAALTGLMQGR